MFHRTAIVRAVVLSLAIIGLSQSARAQGVAEAVLGTPYGVGRLEVPLTAEALPGPLGLAGLTLTEAEGRVFYPAANDRALGTMVTGMLNRSQRPLPQLLGGILSGVPPQTQLFFLFTGEGPLKLTLGTQPPRTVVVQTRSSAPAYSRLLSGWWQAYTAGPGLLQKKPDYPPLLESYLQAMLARRLGLRLPSTASAAWNRELLHELGLALGGEELRVTLARQRMQGQTALQQTADQPLPPALAPPPLELPEPSPGVKVEPIALHVPEECAYVRFGNFTNFLWFHDTLARWGGDLRNLVGQRGLDTAQNDRFQKQIVLQTTTLARMFGEAAIADAAIVASDLALGEGAALGILLQARNNLLVSNDIQGQRRDAKKAQPQIVESKVKLATREVSLIATPDNGVRSFYAHDGDYHFVTNSQTLARRFLEIGQGPGALGKSKEFLHARSIMPGDRGDAVFAYLSGAFFCKLVSPQHRVEMARRVQALADLELAQVARLTAASEGRPGSSMEDLVSGGLLPADFGARPDGSRTLWRPNGAHDSLRGGRGTFLPACDVEITRVTAAEAEDYARFAEQFRQKWSRIDPVVIGVQRKLLPGNKREHVTIDARMTPLDRGTYAFLAQFVGVADQQRLAAIAGDVLAVEGILSRNRLLLGMRDFAGLPNDVAAGGLLQLLGLPGGSLRDFLYGYVGTYGDGFGLLGLLERGFVAPPDAAGYSRSPSDLYRRQFDRFIVYSLHPQILAQVTPQLRFEPAPRAAQIRFHAVDLSQANVAPLANRWIYSRSRQTSLGNLRLLQALSQQIRVPAEDALTAAEMLLGAKLVCPLRGKYALRKPGTPYAYWTSTALESEPESQRPGQIVLPDGFQAPPLDWFRGLTGDLLLREEGITAHVEVDMELTK